MTASPSRQDSPARESSPSRQDSPARQNAWESSLRRWDVYYAIVLALTVLIVVLAAPWRAAAVSSAALLAMVPWYILVGRAAMAGEERPRRAVIYLTGLFVLLLVAERFSGTDTFILFALAPQCFMTVPFRRAVVAVTALNCTPLLAAAAGGQSGSGLAVTTGIAALGIAFSVAFGSWILKIINQSAERADLIEQLEATRAELASAHRDAGVLAERQRISAEIHDTIAQGFASIVMLLQAAEAGLRSDPDGASHHLRLATQTARDNLAEARALVTGLTPAQLDGGTLDDALRRVAAQTRSQAGIAADVEVTGAVRPLATSAEVMLLRVCQEALSNVRKHAGASQACVRLAYDAGQVRLVVSDDGAGFNPAAVNSGYGLRGMRGRVADAGGALCVRSAPGEGTAVSVTVQT